MTTEVYFVVYDTTDETFASNGSLKSTWGIKEIAKKFNSYQEAQNWIIKHVSDSRKEKMEIQLIHVEEKIIQLIEKVVAILPPF